jgi:hypothetical protein
MLQRNTFASAFDAPVRNVPRPLVARTENGMRARATTSNANVDLFGSIGAMRGKDVIPTFAKAYSENKDYALRIAQWARDVRGGSGERQIYRDILLWLEVNDPAILVESNLLENLPELGRFDDLFIFKTKQVQDRALDVFLIALTGNNGLAAKWAPRKGPLAVDLRNRLGMSPKAYRKFIVRNTNVVETQMCAKNWNEINFSHVPSVAMSRYLTAFHRNASEAMEAYKAALVRNDGTAKVNASAVYPYDVTRMLGVTYSPYGGGVRINPQDQTVANAMWETLPDYMNSKNVLPMIDVSGSMTSPAGGHSSKSTVTCMDVSVSLGLYCADKSKGAFKDIMLTFSGGSEMYKLKGSNLAEKLGYIHTKGKDWGSNTNLHAAFDQVLAHALRNAVPASEMPAMLLIISDMQFDHCVRHDDSAMQMARRKYEDAGYELPALVFWNLNDSGSKPVKFNDNGVALISGFSPAVLKSVLSADLDKFNPENIMLQTIGSARYNW